MTAPEDLLDGCDLDFTENPVTDEELPYVVLFASVDESHRGFWGRIEHAHDVRQLAEEWRDLFGGEP